MNRPTVSMLLAVVAFTLVGCASVAPNFSTHHGANLWQERPALLLVHPAIITTQGKPHKLDIRVLPEDALGESVLTVRNRRWFKFAHDELRAQGKA